MTSSPRNRPGRGYLPLRLLDVRDAGAFAAGHAPGAVRVPIEDWIAAARTPEGDFANTAFWSDAFQSLGLGAGSVAGVYDDGRMTEAARVWFILQYFGVATVILNGGWPAVEAAGLSGADPDPHDPDLTPGSGRVGLVDRDRALKDLRWNRDGLRRAHRSRAPWPRSEIQCPRRPSARCGPVAPCRATGRHPPAYPGRAARSADRRRLRPRPPDHHPLRRRRPCSPGRRCRPAGGVLARLGLLPELFRLGRR
jgi:rhodanese-related sulfurtransferase